MIATHTSCQKKAMTKNSSQKDDDTPWSGIPPKLFRLRQGQFSSFYKKKIFAWSIGTHVKRSAILGEEFLDSEQLGRGKIQEMLQEYVLLCNL